MIEFLDLGWVHWGSAVFGVVLFFGLAYLGIASGFAVGRVVGWMQRRRAPQALDRDVEEVRLRAAAPPVPRPRRRHPPELGLYLPAGCRIPSVRHSPILGPDESRRLWALVNGDRDTV